MYHAYNLLNKEAKGLSIGHLDEMLEGQVAILSAGVLSSEQVVSLLDNVYSVLYIDQIKRVIFSIPIKS